MDLKVELKKVVEKFEALERKYNTFNLDQLKDSQLYIIQEEATTLYNEFSKLKNLFVQQGEQMYPINDDDFEYSEVDEAVQTISEAVEQFMTDLETLSDAFNKIGDLDKGSVTFKRLNVFL